MGKLKVKYVPRLPRCAEEIPLNVAELCIRVSGRSVDIRVLRRGFILAAPVMDIIRERISRLALATVNIKRPYPERIGFFPEPSSDWRRFLDDLLQKDDSWSFVLGFAPNQRLS